MGSVYRWLSRVDLGRRAIRGGLHGVRWASDDGIVLVADRTIFRQAPGGEGFRPVHELRHGRRPLPSGFTRTADGTLYYGEYWSNDDRAPVGLWRSDDAGETWILAHEFPDGEVRHIHGIEDGPDGESLWVCTGDRDDESRFLVSEDRGETFEVVEGGSQTYRAASLRFRDGHVYWGTDDPSDANHLYRRDLETGKEERLGTVRGPVYYSTRVGDHLLFSTTVEKGEGNQDGCARIYVVGPDDEVEVLAAFEKDRWHPVLFGYGTIQFPAGEAEDDSFWATLHGLEGGHRSILYELETTS